VDNGGVDLRQGYGTVSTPRFAFVYAPGDFAIKAIYAEAFKDPSSLERYSTIPGIRESASKDLRPERARNVEVSIGRQTPALSADVAVYRASYTDVIGVKESNLYRELNGNASNHFSNRLAECWYFTLISLTDCFVQALQPVGALESRQRIADRFFNEPALKLSFANLATIDVWGAQANGSWRRGGVELAGNYSYVHPEAAAGDSGEQRRVRDIASHRVNVIASGTWRRVDASLRVNVVGSRFTPVENDPLGLLAYLESQGQRFRFAEPLESIAPPLPDELKNDLKRYVVANVAAGYELLPGIAVQAVVENLFDTVYADPGVQTADNVRFAARIPQPGRSLFVRLQTRF
jgi:outer membrane receptor protein involved in Fe transport